MALIPTLTTFKLNEMATNRVFSALKQQIDYFKEISKTSYKDTYHSSFMDVFLFHNQRSTSNYLC